MLNLFPHNKKACDAVQEAPATTSRTCAIHLTETGKSYIAVKMALGFVLCFLLAGWLALGGACAAGIDLSGYSYEELTEIQEAVAARLKEMDREAALANADREITFEQDEQIIYVGREARQLPTVRILRENAPAQTQFVWSSSDPEVAQVGADGIVTAVSRGDAEITCTAADNEYLQGTYTVHAAVPVTKITVWGQETPLVLGGNPDGAVSALGYSIEPEDAYFQNVVWTSSREDIVTVNENGEITGIAPGTAEITATSAEDPMSGKKPVQGRCTVEVRQCVTALELSQGSADMQVGDSFQLKVNAIPENAFDRSVQFTSSNPEVAAVSENGLVTGVAAGQSTILCGTNDGSGITAACMVRVYQPVTGLEIAEKSVSLAIGETRMLETQVLPETATNPELNWTSSNVFIARVAHGRIEAVGQGDCVVTCVTTDGSNLSASVQVRVPTFSTGADAYTVTEKNGLDIAVIRNREDCEITVESESPCFSVEWDGEGTMRVIPLEAGEGTVTLSSPEDRAVIRIEVDNSAVYNEISYPVLPYAEAVMNPAEYEGTQVSVYGKVLGTDARDGQTVLIVGTGGEDYTDQAIWVQADDALMKDAFVYTDDMIKVYGSFYMEHVYSEALEADTPVPVVLAEKLILPERSQPEEPQE